MQSMKPSRFRNLPIDHPVKITGDPPFCESQTDMGVHACGSGIVDDIVVRAAACQEIIRRYFAVACDDARGIGFHETVDRSKLMMESLHASLALYALDMFPQLQGCEVHMTHLPSVGLHDD